MQYLTALLALSGVALGQYGNPPSKHTHKKVAPAKPSPTSSSVPQGVHVVKVGTGSEKYNLKGSLKFTPDTIQAKAGDQIEFEFESVGHSVTQGDFNNPCMPAGPSAFFSGFPNSGGKPFTITVNSTSPTWFYCAQVGHCQAGMVGVINPPAGQTVADYAKAAANAPKTKAPTKVQGGVFAEAKSSSSGGSGGGSSSSKSGSAPAGKASPGAAASQYVLGTLGMIGLTVPLGIAAYGGF